MEHEVKLEIIVPLPHALDQLLQAMERPAVDLEQVLVRNLVRVGVEVGKVAEQIPARVPDPPVRFSQVREDLLGNPDIVAVVRGRNPQPEHLGPVLVDDFLRSHDSARRTCSSSCPTRPR